MIEGVKQSVMNFMERGESFYGMVLKIQESISNNKNNFDRHFTTFNKIEFVLVRLGARISGARLMFDGEIMHYEISVDCLQSIEEVNPLEFEFIEKYSDVIYRKSIIKILKSN